MPSRGEPGFSVKDVRELKKIVTRRSLHGPKTKFLLCVVIFWAMSLHCCTFWRYRRRLGRPARHFNGQFSLAAIQKVLLSGCQGPTSTILSCNLVLYWLLSRSFCWLVYYDPSLDQTIISAKKGVSVLNSATGNCILVIKTRRSSIALCMAKHDLNGRRRVFVEHV